MDVTSFSRTSKMFLGTNADETCVLYGTEQGFKIYDVETSRILVEREVEPISFAQMYKRSNFLVFLGNDKKKLIVWDERSQKRLAEIVFTKPVVKAEFGDKEILVATLEKVYIYSFNELQLLKSFGTTQNPYGALSCNIDRAEKVFAFPGLKQGYVHILRNGISLYVKAHLKTLRVLRLNREGNLLATASEGGTTIRVFDTKTGEKVANFSRGASEAVINNISWSRDSKLLCVSSSRGTTHIFRIGNGVHSSVFGYVSETLGNYASSEASYSSTRFLHPKGISLFCGDKMKHFSSDGYVTDFDRSEQGKISEMSLLEEFK